MPNFEELGLQTLEMVKPYGSAEQKPPDERETISHDHMDFICPITQNSPPVVSLLPPHILTCP
jgi:hypothetical protein